jgi:hypothetical protein
VLGMIGFTRKALHAGQATLDTRFPWAWRVPPYAIGSVAAFWLIQRVAVFAQ